MTEYNEKAAAKKEMVDSIRDLLTLKLTLPLGNPNLRFVHTNQFLWTDLPTDVFELANLKPLGEALNDSYSRFSGYQENRWYIEGVTITHDNTGSKMELDLNPFASDVNKFKDATRGFEDAYNNAKNQQNQNQNNNENNGETKQKVKTVDSDITFHKVKEFGKSDNLFIQLVVKKAMKFAHNPKNPVKQAKAIHDFYKSKHVYSKYNNMPKVKAHGFEGAWKMYHHNCGDGAAILRALYRCMGFTADIFLRSGDHYWVRVKINGKNYYCDQAGGTGCHNWRHFGSGGGDSNVYHGIGGGRIYNNY